jgi:tRNA pseudouridine13 synthase
MMPIQQAIMTVDELAYAYGKPEGRASFKNAAEDFCVQENLSFTPSGKGTHAFLYIEKKDINTQWLARQLARFANVPVKEIGYAGLKDRKSVSRQWFSVNLEVTDEPEWNSFELYGAKILSRTYHKKKLKRGSIKNNHFEILLRDIQQKDISHIKHRLGLIQSTGVPNYFSYQRFGHKHNNLQRAIAWFSGQQTIKKRDEKSIILSAARSMVFNVILSTRISKVGWNVLLDGEVMNINNTRSIFNIDTIGEDIKVRFERGEIHPTAALWGRGQLQSKMQVLEMEQQVSADWAFWCQALENRGLSQDRRAIRLIPQDLTFKLQENNLLLYFCLPAGCYATSVLRELVNTG